MTDLAQSQTVLSSQCHSRDSYRAAKSLSPNFVLFLVHVLILIRYWHNAFVWPIYAPTLGPHLPYRVDLGFARDARSRFVTVFEKEHSQISVPGGGPSNVGQTRPARPSFTSLIVGSFTTMSRREIEIGAHDIRPPRDLRVAKRKCEPRRAAKPEMLPVSKHIRIGGAR